MKKNLLLTSLFCLLFTFNSITQAGKEGGGGQGVAAEKQTLALRDLVDPSTCSWRTALEFQEEFVPDILTFIQQLTKVHWYLANAFEREIGQIRFCATRAPLKEISAEDRDSLAIYEVEGVQVAARLGNDVFVDMTKFEHMTIPGHQSALFIHEISHSFLPMDVPRRNDSLRSFVKMLSGKLSKTSLAINIESNNVNMPPTTDELDSMRETILFVVNEKEPLMDRMQEAISLQFVGALLWKRDQELLSTGLLRRQNALFSKIILAIRSENVLEMTKLYEKNHVHINQKLHVVYLPEFKNDVYAPYTIDQELRRGGQNDNATGLRIAVNESLYHVAEAFLSKANIEVTVSDLHVAIFGEKVYHDGDGQIHLDNITDEYLEIVRKMSAKLGSQSNTVFGSLNFPLMATTKMGKTERQVADLICKTANLSALKCAHQIRGQLW